MSDASKRDSWMTRPPNQKDTRYSVSSFATQVSYDPSEVGEAVSVPVQEQRGDSGEVKQMYVNKRDDVSAVDEEESLFSESQAQLGRLDTIKRRSETEILPEVTIQTELKATVPPRSRRRPVSELYPRGNYATDFTKTHHPRVSLNISDDLDKLMQSANDLKQNDTSFGQERTDLSFGRDRTDMSFGQERTNTSFGQERTDTSFGQERTDSSSGQERTDTSLGQKRTSLYSPTKSISSAPPAATRFYSSGNIQKSSSGSSGEHVPSGGSQESPVVKGKVQHMNFSTDTFETAEGHTTADSSENDSQSRFVLPKRPNEDNMRRARQASANHAQHVNAMHEGGGAPSRKSSVRSKPSMRNSSTCMGEGYNQSNLTLKELAGSDHLEVGYTPGSPENLDSTSSKYLSSDAESGSRMSKPLIYKPSLDAKKSFERNFEADPSAFKDMAASSTFKDMAASSSQKEITPSTEVENISFGDPGHNSSNVLNRNDLGIGSTESIGADLQSDAKYMVVQKSSDSSHIAEIPREVASNKQASIDNNEVSEQASNDDEFYDIEEPVLVSNTVKPKSAKASARKSAKRKSKHNKTKESSTGRLKPFSYNTLVHLLESINGSVIGEEFESLNLPIREKQLIEKIVDSLSRLTSDMIIDEKRYEVGIDRLERAHRVLEGFL